MDTEDVVVIIPTLDEATTVGEVVAAAIAGGSGAVGDLTPLAVDLLDLDSVDSVEFVSHLVGRRLRAADGSPPGLIRRLWQCLKVLLLSWGEIVGHVRPMMKVSSVVVSTTTA